jgi:hypothetical protein
MVLSCEIVLSVAHYSVLPPEGAQTPDDRTPAHGPTVKTPARSAMALETHQRQCNDTAHQAPADVTPSRGDGIPDGAVSVDDNRDGNDPSAGSLRPERGGGNEQDTYADPVHRAGLPDHPQQTPRPPRLDTRVGEHTQLGDGSVRKCDKDGQHTGGLKRQIPHLATSIQKCMVRLRLAD